jgi:membrane fusion protein (multidrug efflux system)
MDEPSASDRSSATAPRLPSETLPLPAPRSRRIFRPVYLVIALAVAALCAFAIFYYVRFVAPYETSDDAFIDGDVTFVSPRVAGPVVRLLVNDNQRVKTGDPLIEIDPNDFQTQLAGARADLAVAHARLEQTKAQVAVDQAKLEQQQAAVTAAEAVAARAKADQARYEAVQSQAVSRSQLDLAKAEAASSAADVDVARSQTKAAAAQLEPDQANIEAAAAQVEQAQARLQQAELDLSYTKVAAPRNGRVTRRTVEQGAYVQPGQNLLALVPDEVWVVANFKETQLTHMRPGQPVALRVDAYPGRVFKGKVDSLQAGSGAQFSLLPPENAVGNYVKVVQRVPVKIVFDKPMDDTNLDFAPGMSVEPKVRVQ